MDSENGLGINNVMLPLTERTQLNEMVIIKEPTLGIQTNLTFKHFLGLPNIPRNPYMTFHKDKTLTRDKSGILVLYI